ncbi:hypothetical protein GE118_02595 [Mycoplasma sp. NEAQ87857]|uniref:MHO_4530 family protein n=1 Tax=Mycoplasma sp. NEAQ87857 TaxID=2683967 RepID=UPI001316BC16|nr:hypothetical protein [Mycoplasma sp. NEAQ87857]QGZ97683.1 hypothetical protein GE118_02595 [Mycoplasma sp. NEAQ87857]
MSWFIVLIFLILFFILICGTFLIILYYLYFRSTSGVIIFVVDNNNQRVLRLTNQYYFFSNIFDSKKMKFDRYSFIRLDDFYTFLDQKDVEILKHFFQNEETELTLEFSINPNIVSNLTLVEKVISFFDKTVLKKNNYYLNIKKVDNNQFIANIKWNNQIKNTKTVFKKQIFGTKKIKSYHPISVIGLSLRPIYYNKELSNNALKDIFDFLEINDFKKVYFYDRDLIYLTLNDISKKKYQTILHKIDLLNKNTILSKYFNSGAIINNWEIKDNNDVEQVLGLIRYANDLNIVNNQQITLTKSTLTSKEYLEYKTNMMIYVAENQNCEFKYQFIDIYRYLTKNKSLLAIAKVKHRNIDPKWIKFFEQIPRFNYSYEELWFNNLNQRNNLEHKNILLKMSQEVFLNQKFKKTNHVIPLVYSDLFEYSELKDKINSNYSLGIATALYVKVIDKPLINVINSTKLKAIVIAKDLAQQLNNTQVYFDCINLVRLASYNKIQIIYEQPRDNLDPLIVKKAKVFIAYNE